MSNNNNKEPKKSDYLKYSSIGIQMAITIGLGVLLGRYLDDKNNTEKPYYTLIFVILSILISLYQVIRDVLKMTKENEENEENEENDKRKE